MSEVVEIADNQQSRACMHGSEKDSVASVQIWKFEHQYEISVTFWKQICSYFNVIGCTAILAFILF